MPRLYKQERKHLTPVRGRLSWTQAVLWEGHTGGVEAGVRDENAESCRFVRPLRIPLLIGPLRRTYVVVVR